MGLDELPHSDDPILVPPPLYELQTWELPAKKLKRDKTGRCRGVGIQLQRSYDIDTVLSEFKFRWFNQDPLIWEMPIIERREWYNHISRDFQTWLNYLQTDSTPEFYMNIASLKKRGGFLVGVNGRKGSGKSWLAQMVIGRIVSTIPHVIFQYKDVERHIDPSYTAEIGVLIDEDLKATGNESRNLVVHVNNIWETNRKAELYGVCTGVNLSFEGWGDTLDMRLTPMGINKETQTTRFGMFDKNNKFVGFAAISRHHRYDDPVYYYDELGKWGEYQSRAIAFSRAVMKSGGAVDAVDAETQTEHIEQFKRYITEYGETHQVPEKAIQFRRLYRMAGLPSKSVGYMNEIISWTRDELGFEDDDDDSDDSDNRVSYSSEGWESLRDALSRLAGFKEFGIYHTEKMSIEEVKMETKYERTTGNLRRKMRESRAQLLQTHNIELGSIGENFVSSHMESLSPVVGGGGKGVSDIVCDVDGTAVHLNVKLCLMDDYDRHIETTPECDRMPYAFVVLVMSRQNMVLLYPVTGELTYVNSRSGVPCGIDTLAQTLVEMVRRVEKPTLP